MKISKIKSHLLDCGYRSDLLRSDYQFSEGQTVNPLVGFSQLPLDARSSCVAVLQTKGDPKSEVQQCRPTGAPLVFVCAGDSLQWWRQGAESPTWVDSVHEDTVEQFFDDRRDDFSPDAIYRAKTWGRFRKEFQLSFVDIGLMPLVEEEVGNALEQFIERSVTSTKSRLGWNVISAEQGHWLLKSVFWLLSARILRDKSVSTFTDLDLPDVDNTFSTLARHYGTPSITIGSNLQREALSQVAEELVRFSNLSLTTTESLAHVYENTLISKATRSELGTHSTPSYLVDYIVGNLSDWIEEIPEAQRSVFEPACGHAAFLVSAMRLLTELLPASKATPGRRRQYLRKRIHGIDKDHFALELARLALTLTDLPNPDGWDLKAEDMFLTDALETQSKTNTILLANPPFENFSESESQHYQAKDASPTISNKAAEMLKRALEAMQPGSVFGFVMPQSVLHAKFASEARRVLLERFELREISLFADNVFSFADVESTVLIGRCVGASTKASNSVRYQKVREWQMDDFRSSYQVANARVVSQSRFVEADDWEMRVPDLEEVWDYFSKHSLLDERASLGQGLQYKGVTLPENAITYSSSEFPASEQGFIRFEPDDIDTTSLPKSFWMSLDDSLIRRALTGTTTGVPQILLNYAPVSRGPWRLKALIDSIGHPVTSRFITVRSNQFSLESLWGILNSPVANAFAFSHLGKRDNIVGVMRKLPVPEGEIFPELDDAVRTYFTAAESGCPADEMQQLLARVDAAVLARYDLPVDLEHKLLSLFDGWERLGVPFCQADLLPQELGGVVRFSDFVKYEADWPSTNGRRGVLIDKKIAGTISPHERTELESLQAYAELYLDRETPTPTRELERLEEMILSRSGKSGGES
ncbi:HsdM family class I SAM-dependent methyltransferase [Rhodopirellula bahusiensis]|uniref:site-specific DNA-methyltransferase (adenine-specific) n=1 Tax=Rhodopirellula bahusiensis TaxID=2014065 RepID=A0A2G1W7U9_9BACT|nr:N-6 DNA methylase [Rhodopirellula bahusiensis]PHQ35112.1 hypothetical protein CEE69_11880 [Rhodopirellula bahusiensis]